MVECRNKTSWQEEQLGNSRVSEEGVMVYTWNKSRASCVMKNKRADQDIFNRKNQQGIMTDGIRDCVWKRLISGT